MQKATETDWTKTPYFLSFRLILGVQPLRKIAKFIHFLSVFKGPVQFKVPSDCGPTNIHMLRSSHYGAHYYYYHYISSTTPGFVGAQVWLVEIKV